MRKAILLFVTFIGLVTLIGCVSKSDLVPYVTFQADIARACLRQCGTNSYVTAYGSINNQLKCECEKVEVTFNKVKKSKKRGKTKTK